MPGHAGRAGRRRDRGRRRCRTSRSPHDAEGWARRWRSCRTGRSAERGFDAPDDGAPLLAMTVDRVRTRLPLADALARLPDVADRPGRRALRPRRRRLRRTWSGGSSTRRSARARAPTSSSSGPSWPTSATTGRRRPRCPSSGGCCSANSGAYWTFLIHTGERTFVGATPERHVSAARRHRGDEPDQRHLPLPAAAAPPSHGVLDFLADRKETDELYMVVDEELKMMARICRRRRPGHSART